MSATFEIVRIAKNGGPLSKFISLDANGKLLSDGSACIMSSGVAERARYASLTAFAETISGCSAHEAIALGRLRSDLPDQVTITTKENLRNGPSAPQVPDNCTPQAPLIARTADYIQYADQQPALALIDIDTKGMPTHVRERIASLGGYGYALMSVLPELGTVGWVARGSTSSGISRADTGEALPGSDGFHAYVLITDGGDSKRFLHTLHNRLWLAGLGWMTIGAGGQLLERSLADKTVWAPERLVFEGPPTLVAPLVQASRNASIKEGPPLDTAKACPDLFVEERAKLNELHARERVRLKPDAAAARVAYVESRALEIARGDSRDVASQADRRTAERVCEGNLLSTLALPFDDPLLAGMTVAHVLADPARFEGETLADPLEGPAYGSCKAKVMLRRDGSPWIHSFAHGRTIYSLFHDADTLRKLLSRTRTDEAVATFAKVILAADLEPGEKTELRKLASTLSGAGVRELDRAEKEAREARDVLLAQETRERHEAARRDSRWRLPLPPPDAERLPLMQQLDRIMAVDPAPALRDLDGWPVEIRCRPPAGMHELGTEDTPAPEMPLITRHNKFTLQHEIERHVEFVSRDKDGLSRSVALHAVFIDHYLNFRDSIVPRVAAVVTTPVVLSGGVLYAPDGLDRARRVVFQIDPLIRCFLPSKAECGPEAAAAAIKFPADDWMADVATDFAGKCVLIGMAATILQRTLLPERPAFILSGGKRGSGKTTTLTMVAAGATGKRPPAAAWSDDRNERRKALLGYLLEGPPLIAWDNIPLGTSISCPHLEKALTSPEYVDRVLGGNATATAPAYSVMTMTGNNIEAVGDLASRTLRCRFDVNRADPENRNFRHRDPVGWTLANRSSILAALYLLLMSNPSTQVENAPTRFKTWWRLVGAAVEHGARCLGRGPISFKDMFEESESESETENKDQGVLVAFLTLTRDGAHGWFTAADIAGLLGIMPALNPSVKAVAAPEDMKQRIREYIAPANVRGAVLIDTKNIGKNLKSLTGKPICVTDDATLKIVKDVMVEGETRKTVGAIMGEAKSITLKLVRLEDRDRKAKHATGHYMVEAIA
jgi:hypothetical protein